MSPVHRESQAVWRAEFWAPVASFRDPLFPGVSRCLPLPPPSTVRGLLAAATGRPPPRMGVGRGGPRRGRAGGEGGDHTHPPPPT
ncbi:CRISPR-associated protein Cas5, partial [Streptomyces sp. NPDC059578]|uniref:CRISPR-associated protein Cas5 n=1 Tax=Streptomyces sp. NPDC059578 TaxID=3346874 RepID=UPI00369AA45B